jgi:hypothetical protein
MANNSGHLSTTKKPRASRHHDRRAQNGHAAPERSHTRAARGTVAGRRATITAWDRLTANQLIADLVAPTNEVARRATGGVSGREQQR